MRTEFGRPRSCMRLSTWAATSTSVADHLLPSRDGALGLGAFRVAGRPLPAHATVLGDVLEVAVALRRFAFSRLARHDSRTRRHDDLRLRMALGDAGVNTILIV